MSDKSIDKLAEQSEIERLKAVNAELLAALKNLYEIRCRQWKQTAEIMFIKGQTLLPWTELQQADSAISHAEGR